MDDAGEGSRATRRQVLGATAGALAVAAISGRTGAQQATDPTVYVGSVEGIDHDGALYAVDAATGDQEWAFTQPTGAVFSSPTVADGTVYVGSFDETLNDETLHAVDAATGDQKWASTQPSWVRSSPTVADGTVYVGSNDETLHAVDAATGDQKWAFTQLSRAVVSSPTVADGIVYVGSRDETLHAVDAATGDQEWAFTQPTGPVLSSPTVVADPESGDSVGSRVPLGPRGYHYDWEYAGLTGLPDERDGEDADGGDDDDTDHPDDGDTDDGFGPGFGVGGALAGLGGAGYLLKRRLDDEDSE